MKKRISAAEKISLEALKMAEKKDRNLKKFSPKQAQEIEASLDVIEGLKKLGRDCPPPSRKALKTLLKKLPSHQPHAFWNRWRSFSRLVPQHRRRWLVPAMCVLAIGVLVGSPGDPLQKRELTAPAVSQTASLSDFQQAELLSQEIEAEFLSLYRDIEELETLSEEFLTDDLLF